MLLIGVKVHGDANELHDILINPIDYVIKTTDDAIVICDDQNTADSFFMDGSMRAEVVNHFAQSINSVPLVLSEE